MDKDIFESPSYRRVFQYLQGHSEDLDLDSFQFDDTEEGTYSDFLETILW